MLTYTYTYLRIHRSRCDQLRVAIAWYLLQRHIQYLVLGSSGDSVLMNSKQEEDSYRQQRSSYMRWVPCARTCFVCFLETVYTTHYVRETGTMFRVVTFVALGRGSMLVREGSQSYVDYGRLSSADFVTITACQNPQQPYNIHAVVRLQIPVKYKQVFPGHQPLYSEL